MSKRNNVNPDHYKVAGRERPAEDVRHESNKREMRVQEKALERQRHKAGSPRSPRGPRKG